MSDNQRFVFTKDDTDFIKKRLQEQPQTARMLTEDLMETIPENDRPGYEMLKSAVNSYLYNHLQKIGYRYKVVGTRNKTRSWYPSSKEKEFEQFFRPSTQRYSDYDDDDCNEESGDDNKTHLVKPNMSYRASVVASNPVSQPSPPPIDDQDLAMVTFCVNRIGGRAGITPLKISEILTNLVDDRFSVDYVVNLLESINKPRQNAHTRVYYGTN